MSPKKNLRNDAQEYSVRSDAFNKEKNLSIKNGEFRAKEDAIAEKKRRAEAFLLEAEGIKANQFVNHGTVSRLHRRTSKTHSQRKTGRKRACMKKLLKSWTLSSKAKDEGRKF
ncbi:MAG: hypothetical protein ACLTE2_11065 [Eubacteriales bacterium]